MHNAYTRHLHAHVGTHTSPHHASSFIHDYTKASKMLYISVYAKIWQISENSSHILIMAAVHWLTHSYIECVCAWWGSGKRYSRSTECLAQSVSAVCDADSPEARADSGCLPTCLCHYLLLLIHTLAPRIYFAMLLKKAPLGKVWRNYKSVFQWD